MEFVKIEKNGISYWAIDEWLEQGLFHGFCGAEINLREGVKDWEKVFKEKKLVCLKQTHSTENVQVTDRNVAQFYQNPPNGDAWIINSELSEYAFGVQTADCFPILITSQSSLALAAIHAGWRGAIAGILPKTIQALGVKSIEDLQIAIGPGAGSCCYEVGKDVFSEFKKWEVNLGVDLFEDELIIIKDDKTFANISRLLALQFFALGGVENNLIVHNSCTICDHRFYSFRREKEFAGRQISFIAGKIFN